MKLLLILTWSLSTLETLRINFGGGGIAFADDTMGWENDDAVDAAAAADDDDDGDLSAKLLWDEETGFERGGGRGVPGRTEVFLD